MEQIIKSVTLQETTKFEEEARANWYGKYPVWMEYILEYIIK